VSTEGKSSSRRIDYIHQFVVLIEANKLSGKKKKQEFVFLSQQKIEVIEEFQSGERKKKEEFLER